MLRFFQKKSILPTLPFVVDIHSHLIPYLDDGVNSPQETLYILGEFTRLGYKKVITTPHVKNDQYPNKTADILSGASSIRQLIEKEKIPIAFEAAAEYFLDDTLLDLLQKNEPLLTFGDKYLLFETSFLNKPAFLEEAIFQMNINGYRPVFAHPERYMYLQSDRRQIRLIKDMNVRLQVNLLSLTGYYSSAAKKLALEMISEEMVDFVGTDCHNALQANEIVKSISRIRNKTLDRLLVENKGLL